MDDADEAIEACGGFGMKHVVQHIHFVANGTMPTKHPGRAEACA